MNVGLRRSNRARWWRCPCVPRDEILRRLIIRSEIPIYGPSGTALPMGLLPRRASSSTRPAESSLNRRPRSWRTINCSAALPSGNTTEPGHEGHDHALQFAIAVGLFHARILHCPWHLNCDRSCHIPRLSVRWIGEAEVARVGRWLRSS